MTCSHQNRHIVYVESPSGKIKVGCERCYKLNLGRLIHDLGKNPINNQFIQSVENEMSNLLATIMKSYSQYKASVYSLLAILSKLPEQELALDEPSNQKQLKRGFTNLDTQYLQKLKSDINKFQSDTSSHTINNKSNYEGGERGNLSETKNERASQNVVSKQSLSKNNRPTPPQMTTYRNQPILKFPGDPPQPRHK